MIPALPFDPESALCAQTDPDLFFPEVGDRYSARVAREVCFSCPLLEPCRTYAMANPDVQGMWGGLTDRQRRDARSGYVPFQRLPDIEKCERAEGAVRRTATCRVPVACEACVTAERAYQRERKRLARERGAA